MDNGYKYFAFISFNSSDAKEALKVQRALETYRLPIAVSRKHHLPRRIGPCFCYLTDISLREELMHELEGRLAESKWLIVVCSPRSAQSAFVNGGIERFISLGRRDRIIPLIVEGVPYSGNPATECFPEALRRHFPKSANPFEDHQILGVNLNEAGAGHKRRTRQRAMVMIMARMLDLNFEDLWQREVKRQRQRRGMILTLLLGILTAVGLTWHMSRSFDMPVTIQEATLPNPTLPQLDKVVMSLYLAGDVRTDTIQNQQGAFRHLPASARRQAVRITAQCEGFLPMDTLVDPTEKVVLNMVRDTYLYGYLSAIVWRGEGVLSHTTLMVAGHPVTTDANGRFTLNLPIQEQRRAYPVAWNGQAADSLYAPCGKNDVICVNN